MAELGRTGKGAGSHVKKHEEGALLEVWSGWSGPVLRADPKTISLPEGALVPIDDCSCWRLMSGNVLSAEACCSWNARGTAGGRHLLGTL